MTYLKLLKYLFLRRALSTLVFFVTSKCNAKCQFCFYRTNKPDQNELSLDEIIKISQKAGKIYELLLSGGEPFLRDDLFQIAVQFCQTNDIQHLNIPTNGFLKDKIVNTVDELSQKIYPKELSLMVSIDDIGQKHDTLRGVPGLFDKATSLIKELLKLQKRRTNLRTGVVTTLTKSNYLNINSLLDYLKKDLGIYFICLNYPRGDLLDKDLQEVPLLAYKQAKEYLFGGVYKQFMSKGAINKISQAIDDLRYNTVYRTLEKKGPEFPCRSGYNNLAVINEIGDVYPCELLDFKLGNLREEGYDLRSILKKNKKRCLQRIVKEKCFCSWECAAHWNILYSPKAYLKIFKNIFNKRR